MRQIEFRVGEGEQVLGTSLPKLVWIQSPRVCNAKLCSTRSSRLEARCGGLWSDEAALDGRICRACSTQSHRECERSAVRIYLRG